MEAQIEDISLTKLEAICKKVFGTEFQDVKENIYSSICAEIFVMGDEITFQDIETLIYYRIKTVSIVRSNTGFKLHVRNMWKNEECMTKWGNGDD